MNNQTIIVKRETYQKDGKEYFAYFIEGAIKGKAVRVNVVPHDIGGYTVLVQGKHTPNAHTYRITTYLLLID